MDKATLDLEVRFTAIEYMIAHTLKLIYNVSGVSEETISEIEREGVQMLRSNTIPGIDAVMADHISDEVATAIERIMRMTAEMRATATK